MAVIAVGGFQHETNTFAPSKADYNAFEQGGGWPPLTFGEAIAPRLAGANIPATGAFATLHAAGHRTPGLAWGAASPSAHVTRDAFERIVGEMTARLAQAGAVDGVYLDLHGAMVTEHLDDGEGEILARVRRIVGPRVPVVASLDLHANVTRAMMEFADGLVAYRTYPHIDMAATGTRAAELLARTLAAGRPLAKAMRPLDFLTGLVVAVDVHRARPPPVRRTASGSSASTTSCCRSRRASRWRTFPNARWRCSATGRTRRACERAVAALAHAVHDAEPEFALDLYSPDEAVARAMQRGAVGAPVVLADTQDNPGAGGNGDTTGLLAALLARDPRDAVLGLLIDRASAQQAHALGLGRTAQFRLGETSGVPGHVPLAGEFTVAALNDGRFTCTGPMFKGFRMELGPMAVLQRGNVRVVLASKKVQAADQAMFRHVGIEPVQQRILALKSSVHFRADFQPIAKEVLVVVAPGPAKADPTMFHWTRLRPGLRLKPLGPAFQPA